MHVCIDRRPVILAASSCGIFTNLGPSAASRRDRAGGLWYWHLHTPWFAVQLYATTDGPSFAYLGRTRHYTTRTPLTRRED